MSIPPDHIYLAQDRFEKSLKNGQDVIAKWPWKRQHFVAQAKIIDLREATIAVELVEARTYHKIGDQLDLPRVDNERWSKRNCVQPIDGHLWQSRKCERPNCKNLIEAGAAERKKYCSTACRFAIYSERRADGRDRRSLVEEMDRLLAKRSVDKELSEAWERLKKALERE